MKKYNKANLNVSPSNIVADRFITKIKYNRIQDIVCPGGLINNYVFSGNDLFDPDHSGTGGWTALGLSQLSNLYGRYKTYSCSIKIQPLAIGSGLSTTSFFMCLIPQVDSSSSGDINDAIMNPYSKFRNFNVNNPFTGNIKHYMSTEKIFGLNKKTVEIDDTYSSVVNGNPPREWFWQLYVQNPTSTGTNNTISVMVTLEYYCEFYNRKASLAA